MWTDSNPNRNVPIKHEHVTSTLMLSNIIHDEITPFSSHQLSDLKNAALMDRVDTKYLCHPQQLIQLLRHLKSHYSILEINNKRVFDYQNVYYDTDDYSLYNMHHNKKLNRFKIRSRHYKDSDLTFLEVKYKDNKGRTKKTRMKTDHSAIKPCAESIHFIQQHGYQHANHLSAKQFSTYKRIALANEEAGVRITIDLQLFFQAINTPKHQKQLDQISVIEVKQHQHNLHNPCIQFLRQLGIRPTSFSKYCMGMALINTPGIKTNRFKPYLNNVL